MAISTIDSTGLATGGIAQTNLATGVAGTGPAFSASLSTNQTVSSATTTKLILNTKTFDTNNCYDATTNYRFTPTVAGYYQVNFYTCTTQLSNANTRYWVSFYKNGSAYNQVFDYNGTSGDYRAFAMSAVIQMNGTTDYLEVYANPSAQALTFYSPLLATTFSASLIRGA